MQHELLPPGLHLCSDGKVGRKARTSAGALGEEPGIRERRPHGHHMPGAPGGAGKTPASGEGGSEEHRQSGQADLS